MTQPSPLSVTRLAGSRQQIGEAHGRQHRPLIHRSLAVYSRLFHDFVGLSWAAARRQAEPFQGMIEKGFPAILDEMEGIARGAGVEFLDILVLNCRSEIALTQASGGCSAFALQGQGSSGWRRTGTGAPTSSTTWWCCIFKGKRPRNWSAWARPAWSQRSV